MLPPASALARAAAASRRRPSSRANRRSASQSCGLAGKAAVGVSDGGRRQQRLSDVAVAARFAPARRRPARNASRRGGTTPPSPRGGDRIGRAAAASTSSSGAGSRSATPCRRCAGRRPLPAKGSAAGDASMSSVRSIRGVVAAEAAVASQDVIQRTRHGRARERVEGPRPVSRRSRVIRCGGIPGRQWYFKLDSVPRRAGARLRPVAPGRGQHRRRRRPHRGPPGASTAGAWVLSARRSPDTSGSPPAVAVKQAYKGGLPSSTTPTGDRQPGTIPGHQQGVAGVPENAGVLIPTAKPPGGVGRATHRDSHPPQE